MTNLYDDVSAPGGDVRGGGAVRLAGEAVFDLSTTALLVIDDTEHIRNWNAAAGIVFGADVLAGRAMPEVFEPDSGLQYRRGMAALVAGDLNWLECSGVICTDYGRPMQVSLRIDPAGSALRGQLFLVQVGELRSADDPEVALARGE